MRPNSPSAITSAAMLPFENERMRNSENSSSDGRPRRPREIPHERKPTSASAEMAKATGTGEIVHGHVKPPRVKGSTLVHQP